MRLWGKVVLVGALLPLAACAVQPAYQRPDLNVAADWSNRASTSAASDLPSAASQKDGWWSSLHDQAVDVLAAAVLDNNPTLAEAAARVDEARATLAVAQGSQQPRLDFESNAAHARFANPAVFAGPRAFTETSAVYGPTLSWEIDLWGRLRQASLAAKDRVAAATADASEARLSLIGQIADGVMDLRACNADLLLRDQDIASRQLELDLMRQRLLKGAVAAVDVARAATNLSVAGTDRVDQQHTCTLVVDSLVALSGVDALRIKALVAEPTSAEDADLAGRLPSPPPLALDLPATVLLRHPTVIAAEREAAARWSQIAVSKADRLPQVDLAAALSGNWLQVLGAATNFDTWSYGGSLSVPVFDGGTGAATVRVAEARYRQSVSQLRLVVRTAAKSVEDALAAQQSANLRVQTTRESVENGSFTLRAALAQRRAGSISQFELEDARRLYNVARASAILAARDRAQAWVDLVRASGDPLDRPPSPLAAAAAVSGKASQ